MNVREFVDDLYDDTDLATPEGCEKMLFRSASSIHNDEFVALALKLREEQQPVTAAVAKINATLGRLRSRYVNALLNWKKPLVDYPDANRTLRLTYGNVQSLSPRDAVHYSYTTTLTGILEKETGEDPFIVPDRLEDLWRKKDFGRYVDPKKSATCWPGQP